MAGNTRGRLKERFEGIHRNFDWSLKHIEACNILVDDKNPALTEAFKALQEGITSLDELAMKIYSTL